MKQFLVLICVLFNFQLKAQSLEFDNVGLSFGLSFRFGSHINQLGFRFKGYYRLDHFQANLETGINYGFKGLGPDEARWEADLKLGVLGALGTQATPNPFMHALSNQTDYSYAAGYAFHFYWDNIQSRQLGGSLALHLKTVELVLENDILAFTGQDKHRTGALGFSWRHQNFRIKQQVLLWTGDQLHEQAKLVRDSGYPSRFGYCDLSATPYGRFSHGLLSIGLDYALPYGQIVGLQVGMDSERVRHFIQNKLIHDFPLVPASWNKAKTPHLPMLQENGSPYLFMDDQKIRPIRFFFDASLNAGLFY